MGSLGFLGYVSNLGLRGEQPNALPLSMSKTLPLKSDVQHNYATVTAAAVAFTAFAAVVTYKYPLER